jgi:6-pyruvoyltetrahydropterin/6-carboxytetrahydropterin synthase
MYTVAKSFSFCAAHHNPLDDGPCGINHGHNWSVEFVFRGDTLDHRGWLIGFDDIRHAVKPLIDALDHSDLNQTLPINPTCENIAKWFHGQIAEMIPALHETRVTERAGEWTTYAAYTPSEAA